MTVENAVESVDSPEVPRREAAARRSQEIAAAFDKKAFGEAIENIYESVL